MATYILRRLLMLIPILLGVTLITFAIIQVTPGDPVRLMLGPYATPEQIVEIRQQLGLDDPMLVQYGRYILGVVQGDLGRSIHGRTPVVDEIAKRLPSTLELAVAGLSLAIIGGVTVGAIAAMSGSRKLDATLMVGALAGLSLPVFWLALILIQIFAVRLDWVSATGGEGMKDLILPAICVALAPGAVLARVTRSSILEVIRKDYVRTARAKGLQSIRINMHHILRSALIPVVTVIGLLGSNLLTGMVFVETIFSRPGLGRYAVEAVFSRDFPRVRGVVLFMAVVFVLVNLAVDILYTYLDPRIRYS